MAAPPPPPASVRVAYAAPFDAPPVSPPTAPRVAPGVITRDEFSALAAQTRDGFSAQAAQNAEVLSVLRAHGALGTGAPPPADHDQDSTPDSPRRRPKPPTSAARSVGPRSGGAARAFR